MEPVQAGLGSADPDGPITPFGQTLDVVVLETRQAEPGVVIEGGPVEAHQAGLRADPEEAIPRFQQGHDRVLEQAILAAPGALRVGGERPGRVQGKGRDGQPDPWQRHDKPSPSSPE